MPLFKRNKPSAQPAKPAVAEENTVEAPQQVTLASGRLAPVFLRMYRWVVSVNLAADVYQIESGEQAPFRVLGPDGQWTEDPEHVTLYFTASTETPTTEVMTTKVGDQEVRIGKKDYILKSEYIEINGGTIIDVKWEK